jgi:hypothetical protein
MGTSLLSRFDSPGGGCAPHARLALNAGQRAELPQAQAPAGGFGTEQGPPATGRSVRRTVGAHRPTDPSRIDYLVLLVALMQARRGTAL